MLDSEMLHLSPKTNKNRNLEVVGFSGPPFVQSRLQELGIHVGCELQVVGQAPFSGPMLLRVGSIVLALRVNEAQCIQVKAKV